MTVSITMVVARMISAMASTSTAKTPNDETVPAPDAAQVTSPRSRATRGRRAPAPQERQRDAERSRELLLQAALEEFAAKGFSGARVQDIAARAGVNKQLISYYFGGKEGLYQAIQHRWLEAEAAFTDPDLPLDALLTGYLRAALAEPHLARLLAWSAVEGASLPGQAVISLGPEDIADLERRQRNGELAADLDPFSVGLALMGAVLAPVVLPHVVRSAGLDPESPEFAEHYAEQLRRIILRLRDQKHDPPGA
jgi:TetR/AcrR family transcriptional regulator